MSVYAIAMVSLIIAILLLVYGGWMLLRKHYGDAVLLFILFVLAMLVAQAIGQYI